MGHITENTPDGYQDPIFTVNGIVKAPGNTVTVVIGDEDTQSLTYTISVENRPFGSVPITKTDATSGVGIIGAIFQLISLQNGIETVIDTVTMTTSTYQWTDLPWGSYIAREIAAPTGYIAAADATVVLDSDLSEISFTVANARIPGEVTIIKVDPEGNVIEGGVFNIADSNGNVLSRVIAGVTSVGGLSWGVPYYVTEEVAPPGYIRDEFPFIVLFSAASTTATVTIENAVIGVGGIVETRVIRTPARVIEVLGINELLFTGLNSIFFLAGLLAIIASVVLLFVFRKRRRKNNTA